MDEKTIRRIQELEKQRDAGKPVPELDALYQMVDEREKRGYEAVKPPLPAVKPASTPKKFAKGGAVKSSASKRADGCAVKGKTRGRMV